MGVEPIRPERQSSMLPKHLQSAWAEIYKHQERKVNSMNEDQIEILRNMQGFIEFASNDGSMDMNSVLITLGYDIGGLMRRDKWMSPRTSGYAKFLKSGGEDEGDDSHGSYAIML